MKRKIKYSTKYSDQEIMHKAIKILDEELPGGARAVRRLIRPLIHKKNPDALFLNAYIGSGHETDDKFDQRTLKTICQLAKQDYAPAIHQLAVWYELGDYVEQDTHLSAQLYLKSMNLGYPNSKHYHGLNLFYGSHGIEQNKEEGLRLIKEAVDADFPLAQDIFEDLTSE